MLFSIIFCFLISGVLTLQSETNDHALKKHFEAHRQNDWNAFESLTAQGEWHLGPDMYLVDYFIKKPNKWSAIAKEGKQQLISNQLFAGQIGLAPNNSQALEPAEAIALSYVWSFGSPLYSIADQLQRKEELQVDQIPCHWYQYQKETMTYDFFISQKDHLFYKVVVTNEEGLVQSSTTIRQYRQFGPYQMPSQVTIKTEHLEYLMVFTDYVIGDYVDDRIFLPGK